MQRVGSTINKISLTHNLVRSVELLNVWINRFHIIRSARKPRSLLIYILLLRCLQFYDLWHFFSKGISQVFSFICCWIIFTGNQKTRQKNQWEIQYLHIEQKNWTELWFYDEKWILLSTENHNRVFGYFCFFFSVHL